MKDDLISIIVVNYNGKKWLKNFFTSLEQQSYKYFEVIIVDNASSDDSVNFIENKKTIFPVKVIKSTSNVGFAEGNNKGLQTTKGKYIYLLNNDTKFGPDFLEKTLDGFKELPNASIIQPKILQMEDTNLIDSAGSFWTNTTILNHYGRMQDKSLDKYNKSYPIFSPKGAAMIIKKQVIEDIDLFDNDFWCYYEESDFCYRAWLLGYESWYYPKAEIYHVGGATSEVFDNSFIQFHNYKNKLLSYLKNFQISSLLYILPVYIVVTIILSVLWIFQGKLKQSFAIYKSFFWNIIHIKQTLIKRSKIQAIRKFTDASIFRKTTKNPRLSYYYFLFTDLKKYNE